MELSIQANGNFILKLLILINIGKLALKLDRVRENKSGQMGLYTKDGGEIIKPTRMEGSSMVTAIFRMVAGRMRKPMVMVRTVTQMVPRISEIGRKINNMEKDLKDGLMEQAMKEDILKERNNYYC